MPSAATGTPLSARRKCARCWRRRGCATGTVSRRAGTISASICTWPMAGAIAGGALRVFAPRREAIARKPHQPHYQSRDYNPLNGGIERWFEPVTEAIGAHPAMRAILTTCHGAVRPADPGGTASAGLACRGAPVPHRGAGRGRPASRPPRACTATASIGCWCCSSTGSTSRAARRRSPISANAPLGSFTLSDPLDAAVTDDNRVFHGVTPVTPLDPDRPGTPRRAGRDVPAGIALRIFAAP